MTQKREKLNVEEAARLISKVGIVEKSSANCRISSSAGDTLNEQNRTK